jgi:hypothetical protein
MAYVPFKKGGWAFAAFISIVTIGMYLGAYAIHQATYRSPRDPTTLGAISHNHASP